MKLEKKVIIEWTMGFLSTERITNFNKIIKHIEKETDPQKIVDIIMLYKGEEPGCRSSKTINFSNKS